MVTRLLTVTLLACLGLCLRPPMGLADDKDEVHAAFGKAQKMEKEGRYAEAAAEYEKALKLDSRIFPQNHLNTAAILNNLARMYQLLGKYAKAEPLYRRALNIRLKVLGPDHTDVADSRSNLGTLYVDQGKYAEAEPLHKRALDIRVKAFGEEHPRVADSLNNLANLYKKQGKYEDAERLFQRALAIRQKVLGDQHPDVAQSLYNLANLDQAQGKYTEAERLYKRALAIRETVFGKEHSLVANVLNGLACLYHAQGKYAEAERLYKRSRDILVKAFGELHPDVAYTLNNLAILYKDQGKYAEAEALYQRALAIYEMVHGKEHLDVAGSLNNLAALYMEQGKYAEAEPLYRRSLAIREKVLGDQHPYVAESLNNLALFYERQGKHAEAEPLYRRALAIQEKVLGDQHPTFATTLANLAVLYYFQGKYAEAEPLFRRSLAIREKVFDKEHPLVATSLNHLAALCKVQEKFGEAERLFNNALKIQEKAFGKAHPDVALTLANLVILSADQGKYALAAEYQTRLRQTTRRFLLGELPSFSAREQQQLLAVNERRRLAVALSLGFRRPDDPNVAIPSAAWLLNGKAIAVEAQALRNRLDLEITDPRDKRLLAQIRDLRSQEAALALRTGTAVQRQQLEDRRRQLEKQLARKSSTAALLADPWVELDTVRKAIPADGVLVDIARFKPSRFEVKPGGQYSDDAERYVAWVIPREGAIKIVDLGEVKPIDEAIAAVLKDIGTAALRLSEKKKDGQVIKPAEDENKVEGETVQKLAALSKLVWEPLKPHVGEATRLILSPDGDLWLLPWAALPVARDKSGHRYLVEVCTLQLVVSGRDLVEPAKVGEPIRPTRAVIVADPDYGLPPAKGGNGKALPGLSHDTHKIPIVPQLPGTSIEARAAFTKLKAFLSVEPMVYRQAEATKTVVLGARSPELLALMTHGFFLKKQQIDQKDESRGLAPGGEKRSVPVLKDADGKEVEDPLLRCGLLFAGANRRKADGGDNGILTGQEVVALDLRGTRVVILSACETAVGETNTGEGVAGLRQAFQLAGAKSVLATLWQIDDTATVRLMNPFYERLAKASDRAEALTRAQRQFVAERRKRYGAAHPYFWAAFTMTGR